MRCSMKQHITKEDLGQLNILGRERLVQWWDPQYGDIYLTIPHNPTHTPHTNLVENWNAKDNHWKEWKKNTNDEYNLPLLSIGRMIEFLTKETQGGEWMSIQSESACNQLWYICVKELNKPVHN